MKLLAVCVALTLPLSAWAADSAQTTEPENWNLKLQSTYVWQQKPALNAPYEGSHSLTGAREKSYSFTATAGLGLRLSPSTEFYLDPEVAQGVPLSGLQGLAGFSNGEMARTAGPHPKLYKARMFVRQVIGLSDEREDVASAMNQLGGSYAKQRWVLSGGFMSVLDIFDANSYNHDPRSQFMNWTLMTHGAYDYAADARGYSLGATAEYITPDWSIRFGRFIQPKEPNQLDLEPRIGRHYGDQIELEHHYLLSDDKAGVARLLAFRNHALMSNYQDALDLAASTNTVPDLASVRTRDQNKVGLGLNVEQVLTADVGLFARAMWADGQTETYAFTEVDRSVSAGLSINGHAWSRATDTLGLAVAANLLSHTHRQVLEAGGQTFFLGDGRLNYRPERVWEAYYLSNLGHGLAISADYQRIQSPGYNADRGPASFLAMRLHAEY